MDTAMPTTDTMDIPMPTMDTTMARGPLMLRLPPLLRPSLRLRLMPMLTIMPTAMASTDTTDIPMPTMDTTTARGPLMLMLPPLLRLMLMLTTDTTDMPVLMPTDMPTVPTDTTATPT